MTGRHEAIHAIDDMSRFRIPVLLTALLAWQGVFGQDIADIQSRLDEKQAAAAELKAALADRQQAAKALEAELQRLRAGVSDLEQRKQKALEAMDAQYKRIVADPSLELSAAQAGYREALAALQRQRQAIAAKQQQIAQAGQQVEQARRATDEADRAMDELRQGLDVARAERLHRELNVEGEIKLSNTITCKRNETIAACMERGRAAALEQARQRFSDRLYAAATEAELVARHRGTGDAAPALIDSKVTDSGFRGQGDYRVELQARLRNETSPADACRLLGLKPAQCRARAPSAPAPATAPAGTAEAQAAAAGSGEHLLTVRSNVYYDEVFIDGVSYGSTKLDVLLPAGEYDVEVSKPGHASFRQRVKLDRAQTVRADLPELTN
jgi:phage shock protein A